MLIALLNMSVVQTSLGRLASNFFSKEWKTTVKIEGISVNIFNHVSLYGVELLHPSGDTIMESKEIRCRFNAFPVSGEGLKVQRVYLGETTFNLKKYEDGLNLKFIIDYFKSQEPDDEEPAKPFPIRVGELIMKNVNFSLDLTEGDTSNLKPYGVQHQQMTYQNINANIRDISVIKDSIHANFVRFKTTEKSGFDILDMRMDATVSSKGIKAKNARIQTPTTKLLFDAELKYRHWKTMGSYIDSVQMTAHFKEGNYGNFKDAGYWAEVLWGINEQVFFSGHFSGTVANLRSDDFEISFGEKTHLTGQGSIVGLPNIRNTIIEGSVYDLRTHLDDLTSSKFLQRFVKLDFPAFLHKTGDILLNAHFYGKIDDFKAKADLQSDLGFVDVEVALKHNPAINDYTYGGLLHLNNFQVKDVVNSAIVERASLDVVFKGSGTKLENIDAEVVGKSNDFVLFGNQYDSLDFNVKAYKKNIDADLTLVDNSIQLDFDGKIDFNSKEKLLCDFTADIQNARLGDLNLFEVRDSNAVFSSKLNVNFTGGTLDNFLGIIDISGLHYYENGKNLNVDSINIQAQDDGTQKTVAIHSDIFDFDMQGHFQFRKFGLIVNNFLDNYVPQYFHRQSFVNLFDTLGKQDFKFHLVLKNTDDLTNIFVPDLRVSPNTIYTGNYDTETGLYTNLSSDSIVFSAMDFKNIKLSTMPDSSKMRYLADLEVQNFTTAELIPLENLKCRLSAEPESFDVSLNWRDTMQVSQNNGHFKLVAHTEPLQMQAFFTETDLMVNGEKWNIDPQNRILYSETALNIHDFTFMSKDQRIAINSEISDAVDEISLEFTDFKLEQFNVLTKNIGLDLSALVNGTFYLHETKNTPFFKSNLKFKNTVINGEKFGEMSVLASYDAQNERIKLDMNTTYTGNVGTIHPINVSGYFYPGTTRDNNYDFAVKFNNFKLRTIDDFVTSFAETLEGNVNGNIAVKGKLAQPQFSGELDFDMGKIKINFLNTTYNFSDKVRITNNAFLINDFTLIDAAANTAKINGKITHNNLKDFKFDVNIASKNFMFLNTTAKSRNPYYGKVVADGNVKIKGSLDDLSMNIQAKTMKGTDLSIPISSKMDVSQNQFVQFVVKDTAAEENANLATIEENPLNVRLTIDLEATPDAKISLPLNFQQMTGDLTASGKGNLRLAINTLKSDFKMYGNYEVASGAFKLNFLNLVDKTFELEKGGTIVWTGEPTNASLNVSGIYRLRASLSPLLGSDAQMISGGNSSQKPIPVESVIMLSGRLANPNIAFDIRLPHADQGTQDLVFGIIDKNNQNEMLQQTASLLMVSAFNPVNTSSTTNYGQAVTANIVEALSAQLSTLLANNFVNINIDYKASEEGSTVGNQLNVNLSKDYGRWYYEGSLGMGVNSSNGSSSNINNTSNANKYFFEFLLGYRITESIHVQTYNRQNTNEFTREESPYVQGVGLTYQKEFDRISEIFSKKKKKTGTPQKVKSEEQKTK